MRQTAKTPLSSGQAATCRLRQQWFPSLQVPSLNHPVHPAMTDGLLLSNQDVTHSLPPSATGFHGCLSAHAKTPRFRVNRRSLPGSSVRTGTLRSPAGFTSSTAASTLAGPAGLPVTASRPRQPPPSPSQLPSQGPDGTEGGTSAPSLGVVVWLLNLQVTAQTPQLRTWRQSWKSG